MEIGDNVGLGMEKGIEGRKSNIANKAREMSKKLTENINAGEVKQNAVSKGASAALKKQINNQKSISNNNFQPNINMQVPSNQDSSEERRKTEQLLRKLGAEYKK